MDISLHNIQNLYDTKQNKKKELYNKIFLRAINLIKESAQLGKNMCMYQIPELILGIPIYNVQECLLYIQGILISKKFNIVIAKPNIIFIFWQLKNKLIKYNSKPNQASIEYSESNKQETTNHIKNISIPQTFFFNH